jgi:hypothetical protein
MSASEQSSTCYCIRFLHNLPNVLVQIENKMGLQQKLYWSSYTFILLEEADAMHCHCTRNEQ